VDARATDAPLLTEAERQRALARYDLLRLCEQKIRAGRRQRSGRRSRRQLRELCADSYAAGTWPEIRARLGGEPISARTLERWQRALQAAGGNYEALADRRRLERPRETKLSPAAQAQLKIYAQIPNQLLTSEVIYRARKKLNDHGFSTAFSDSTARRWLQEWRAHHGTELAYAYGGEKRLREEFLPPLLRDWSKLAVGQVLVADGHTFNFEVSNPATGKGFRPTLIGWYCPRSNYLAGWEIMGTENTEAISVALRRAILRLGQVPEFAYLDNGAAFRAKYFRGCPDFDQAGLTGLYQRLGITMVSAIPYNPESKPIERFFKTCAGLERLMPSYCGTDLEHKPPRMQMGEKLHRKLYQAVTGGELPTIEEVHRLIAWWLDEDYGVRPSTAEHLRGQAPLIAFEAGRGPGVDERLLDWLMMAEKQSLVYKQGVKLRLEGETAFFYHEALCRYVGKNVTMRYDRAALALGQTESVLIYAADSKGGEPRFLCEAEPWEKNHPLVNYLGTEEERAIYDKQIAIKRRLRREIVAPAREFLERHVAPAAAAQEGLAECRREKRRLLEQGQALEIRQPEISPAEAAAFDEAAEIECRAAAAEAAARRLREFAELVKLPGFKRYDKLRELEAQGEALPEQELSWIMRYMQTEDYRANREYLEERSAGYLDYYGGQAKAADKA